MNEPVISIDRASKSFAVFDGLKLVFGFTPYENEDGAILDGKKIVAEKTDKEPEIVYPKITSMRIITSRRRRK
jgi:hypothetical protein